MQGGKRLITPPSDAACTCGRQRQPRRPRGGLQVVAAVKRGSDKTIVCSKTVIARKGSEAAVQDLCQQVTAGCNWLLCALVASSNRNPHADRTRQASGCQTGHLRRIGAYRLNLDDLSSAQVLDFSRERMADRTNGILEFSVNHDFQDANVFHFWERYTSNASLGQHNTQPEVTRFMEDVSRSNSKHAVITVEHQRLCS